MWRNESINTTKEKIIEVANEKSKFFGSIGGFINTDGAWCATQNADEFKAMLEYFFNFEIIECKETANSTAIATTKCGLQIAWNGHCRVID